MDEKVKKKDIVVDKGKWEWSELVKKEDWWSIWLGFIILIVGAIMYLPMGDSYQAKDKKTKQIVTITPRKSIAKYKKEIKAIEADMKSGKIPYKTVHYYSLKDKVKKFQAKNSTLGKAWKKITNKPHNWSNNPLDAFYMSKEREKEVTANMKAEVKVLMIQMKEKEKELAKMLANADSLEKKKTIQERFLKSEIAPILMDSKNIFFTNKVIKEAVAKAKKADSEAKEAGYTDKNLNEAAILAIKDWRDKKPVKKGVKKKGVATYKHHSQWWRLIILMVGMGLFFSIGMVAMGESAGKFLNGWVFVFIITCLAFMMAHQVNIKGLGFGYAAWAIIIGLLISNTIGTPEWVKPAVQTEYYIKTGLVLLGAKILFGKLTAIGGPGIFVAWVVTPIVLLTTYWFGQKIVGMSSKTLNITISADMSVCGVSAAIATAAACKAKKEELTLAVGLSLVFTSVMMIVMPAFINATFPSGKEGHYMAQILGGAWMGGTIDATGAVAAAGAFLGESALYVAATIKMIQNILIGVIAFFVAIYWTTKVEASETGEKPGISEIWYRFPKFVIGFIVASAVFSLIYASLAKAGLSNALVKQGVIKGMSDIFRGWFFCLAFVSIGLATNFRELAHHFKGGKPLILYVCGQSLNLVLTLIMSYVMFYKVFPGVVDSIVAK